MSDCPACYGRGTVSATRTAHPEHSEPFDVTAIIAELREACIKMARNWGQGSGSLSLAGYAVHSASCAGDCEGGACACGKQQSLAEFLAGRAAIDAALSTLREFGFEQGTLDALREQCGKEV